MNTAFAFILSFLCATISALGMGGGGILLMYLTVYAGVEQLTAQGINLIFFIPVAVVAICIHAKKKLIVWKTTLLFVALGIPGVWLGWKLANTIPIGALSKLFGVFLLVIGLRELFSKPASSAMEKE